METKNVIYDLRIKSGLSQEELAERVYVTRQAVSRWENGETVPNTETLKLLSGLFGVSINTLLGAPTALYCACCGMLLEDSFISREKDGYLNQDYCKWCYADGEYTLDFWKKYDPHANREAFEAFKAKLVSEINVLLHPMGLPRVEDLNVLSGAFINMEYTLPSGVTVKFLDDNATYLGSQLAGKSGRCYGIAANTELILICSYGENGENPELVIFKKR